MHRSLRPRCRYPAQLYSPAAISGTTSYSAARGISPSHISLRRSHRTSLGALAAVPSAVRDTWRHTMADRAASSRLSLGINRRHAHSPAHQLRAQHAPSPPRSLFKKSLGVIVWIPKLAMAEMVRQGRRPGWLQRGWRDSRRLSSRLARGGDGRGERGLSTSFPCWIAAQPPGGAGVGGEAKEGRVVDAQSWRWRRSAVMTRRPCQT